MLREFLQVKQEAGAGRRRWFEDGDMELIVWLGQQEQLEGFQLCYRGALDREHALSWRPRLGFTHSSVDSGDTRPDKNLTPILIPDGAVPWERLRREFAERGAALEPALRDFISARLAEGAR